MRYIGHMTIAVMILSACLEPYVPEVGQYDSTLVVDGTFTDGTEDTSIVILSRSYGYTEGEPEYLSGAQVIIEDDQGNQNTLEEREPGKYYNYPEVFPGIPGRSYRVLITVPGGNQFESSWESLKPSPPIKDIFFESDIRDVDDPDKRPRKGLQIMLSTEDPENNTHFYRWEFVETYQYGLTYPPVFRVEFGKQPGEGDDMVFFIPPAEWEGTRCWKTTSSTRFYAASTENLTRDAVERYPLLFVDTQTPRLYHRFSLLIKQYAISKEYYEFLRTVEATNQTTGSLFDPIPNEVFGNIRASDGSRIPVLGYFSVAGITSTRYFIERDDIPEDFFPPYGPRCANDTTELDFRDLYGFVATGNRTLYDYLYDDFGNRIGFVITPITCASCAASGATNKQPDFW